MIRIQVHSGGLSFGMSTTIPPAGPITNRVRRILADQDHELIAVMPSGYAILGKYQPEPITGCCMLLPKLDTTGSVVASPNDLGHTERAQFFSDLVLLGDAIMQATGSERINYLVLCNQVPELHGHCVPRFETEDPGKRMQGPFEAYDFGNARVADAQGQDATLHARLKENLEALMRSRD